MTTAPKPLRWCQHTTSHGLPPQLLMPSSQATDTPCINIASSGTFISLSLYTDADSPNASAAGIKIAPTAPPSGRTINDSYKAAHSETSQAVLRAEENIGVDITWNLLDFHPPFELASQFSVYQFADPLYLGHNGRIGRTMEAPPCLTGVKPALSDV
ncbi:hypothetical protein RSAG8_10989, partial [Rhizoctonia solani AG-8 WAC10335]